MGSYLTCEHGIDLSGAPCHICEQKPEWDVCGKLNKVKEVKEVKKVENRIKYEEAIAILIEAGFVVTNKFGGYIGKHESYHHQSRDKSIYLIDKTNAIKSFF